MQLQRSAHSCNEVTAQLTSSPCIEKQSRRLKASKPVSSRLIHILAIVQEDRADNEDAVFSYSLPFNLLAVVIMWPMRYILNARWFHKLNGELAGIPARGGSMTLC